MNLTRHREVREYFKWGTFGKYGQEEMKSILLKDINDSHLVHIIGHVLNYLPRCFRRIN